MASVLYQAFIGRVFVIYDHGEVIGAGYVEDVKHNRHKTKKTKFTTTLKLRLVNDEPEQDEIREMRLEDAGWDVETRTGIVFVVGPTFALFLPKEPPYTIPAEMMPACPPLPAVEKRWRDLKLQANKA